MKLQNDFIDALLKEIQIRRDYLVGESVKTVYFGGGTPSLLEKNQVDAILQALAANFSIEESAEITLEANPDDVHPSKLDEWRSSGINRLSIGIQSFFEEDLRWMNRAHDATQANDCLDLALGHGFTNLNVDLIYGGPTLTDDKWKYNLEKVTERPIPHLSCYALTVEPGTALDNMTRRKKVADVNNEDQARQFLFMTDFLRGKGYEHYEISNFALPGHRSQHNTSYWKGEKYLGLGPSAHSFNGTERQWNVSNNALYIGSLVKGEVPYEREILTPVQRLNEYIMTSLRTMEGTDAKWIAEHFGNMQAEELIESSEKFRQKGWLEKRENKLVLTTEGKLFADGIAAELFMDDVQTSTDSIFLNASRG